MRHILVIPLFLLLISCSIQKESRDPYFIESKTNNVLLLPSPWTETMTPSPSQTNTITNTPNIVFTQSKLATLTPRTDLLMKTLTSRSKGIGSISFTSNNLSLIDGTTDGIIEIWNIDNGVKSQEIDLEESDNNNYYSFVFSRKEKVFIAGDSNGIIRIWNWNTGELIKKINAHNHTIYSLALSPNGIILASGTVNEQIKLWNIKTGELVQTIPGLEENTSLLFSPDGGSLAIGGCIDEGRGKIATIKMWNLIDGIFSFEMSSAGGKCILSMDFSPDGKLLSSVGSGAPAGSLIIWDAKTGESIWGWGGEIQMGVVSFSPDGNYVANGGYGVVLIWNIKTHEVINIQSGHKDFITTLEYSSDGRILACGGRDYYITLLDLRMM